MGQIFILQSNVFCFLPILAVNAQQPKLILPIGHATLVTNAAFSPDGKYVATASYDNTVKVWNVSNGFLVCTLNQTESISLLQFSQDAKKLITASNNILKVWDLVTGSLLFEKIFSKSVYKIDTLRGLSAYINVGLRSAKFSPDGQIIVSLSDDNIVELWDTSADTLLYHFTLDGLIPGLGERTHIHNIFLQFSPDGKKLAAISPDNTVKVWDALTGILIADLKDYLNNVRSFQFSPNGNKIVALSYDNSIKIWNDTTLILLSGLKQNSFLKTCKYYQLSPDGERITVLLGDTSIKIFDCLVGTLLSDLIVDSVLENFSPDGRKVATVSDYNNVKIWDIPSSNLVCNLKGHTQFVEDLRFVDEKKIMMSSIIHKDTISKIWDITNGTLITTRNKDFNNNNKRFPIGERLDHYIDDANFFLPDSLREMIKARNLFNERNSSLFEDFTNTLKKIKIIYAQVHDDKILAVFTDTVAIVWNKREKGFGIRLQGLPSLIYTAQFSPDGKKIAASCWDNTVNLWDAQNGNLLYTFFALDSNDYLSQIPTRYYLCTKNASKLLHYVDKDLKVLTFKQLDVKYNRPDKVLQSIGNTDTALINSYFEAYQRRIKRLEIDTTAFSDDYSVPETDIVNREEIESKQEQQTQEIKLHIRGIDSTYCLDRFNVWMNEVPLFGLKGISIRNQNSNTFDTTITIDLSQGENRIETSTFNSNAIESYRIPLLVNYSPASPVIDTLYFIGIGVNQYKNDTTLNLSFAAKDIRDLDELFSEGKKIAVVSKIFIDSSSTRENILAVKNLLMKTGINDKVVIALSGHGVLYDQKDFYFGTYDIDFNKPNKRGLKYEELESLLDDIPARKKLLLIDACHSGEVDTSINVPYVSKGQNPSGRQPVDTTKKNKGDPDEEIKTTLGLDNSFELMKEMFADLSRGNGAVVISAARGRGYAEEDHTWSNGAFTLCLKAAFSGNDKFPELKETADKNGDGVSINELKEYILTKVPLLTKDRQKPTTRRENIEVDWKLW